MAQMSFLLIGGNDAPGIRIVPDGHGGWKIVRVPGWDPEQMLELGSVLQVAAGAGRIREGRTSQALLKSAMPLVQSQLEHALGKDVAAENVIVVVANAR